MIQALQPNFWPISSRSGVSQVTTSSTPSWRPPSWHRRIFSGMLRQIVSSLLSRCWLGWFLGVGCTSVVLRGHCLQLFVCEVWRNFGVGEEEKYFTRCWRVKSKERGRRWWGVGWASDVSFPSPLKSFDHLTQIENSIGLWGFGRSNLEAARWQKGLN